MIGRSKDEEVHCFLLQNKNAHAPSVCEHQSTTRRSPRTTERLWHLSSLDSLVVDETCLTNPISPKKTNHDDLREKPTWAPSYNTSGGGSIGLRRQGVQLGNRGDRSISGYPKGSGARQGYRPDEARRLERMVLEFLIQVPFSPNRVDGGIDQQLENKRS